MTTEDLKKILDAAKIIYEAPFHIVSAPDMKLFDLCSHARILRSQQKIEIMFIDYLGLKDGESSTVSSIEQITEISRSLKSLAVELQIPVVLLCQVSSRVPYFEEQTLAHIRDFQKDADTVFCLQRPHAYISKQIFSNLLIDKQREGNTGVVTLALNAATKKFVSVEAKMTESPLEIEWWRNENGMD